MENTEKNAYIGKFRYLDLYLALFLYRNTVYIT